MSAPNAWQVGQAVSAWQSARARLLADDPELACDEAALADLLGPENGDVQDILARVLRASQHAGDMADKAKDRARQITDRAKRYEARAQSLRGLGFSIMEVIGKTKVELPDLTATIRRGVPSAHITDEDAIPDEFAQITRKIDKAAILAALKAGQIIPGAELSNSMPSLAIKGT